MPSSWPRATGNRWQKGSITEARLLELGVVIGKPGRCHIDLSHTIEDGLITYKGLPAPLICDHLSRAASRALYAEGTEFQIGRITMVPNTDRRTPARARAVAGQRPALFGCAAEGARDGDFSRAGVRDVLISTYDSARDVTVAILDTARAQVRHFPCQRHEPADVWLEYTDLRSASEYRSRRDCGYHGPGRIAMSSVLKPAASSPGGVELPFASYAQIIRMLVPPAERISFYDAAASALWINDGVEEPDFRMHVELALTRSRQSAAPASAAAGTHPDDDAAFVFVVRNTHNAVVGAIGIACRNLPSGARFRSADAVERMLAPVITILGHAWPVTAKVVPLPTPTRETGTRQAAVAATQLLPSMPVPAMLRKALTLATELIDCAFGAVVLPQRPFTLSHCVSADESDLSITAAIDSIREHVLRRMQTRSEPLVVNGTTGKTQQLPYKLLVVPVRDPTQRVVALLMLFRSKRARDFAGVDIDELTQLAARIPTDALGAMLVPEAPVIAAVVKPPLAQPQAATPSSPRPQPAARAGTGAPAKAVAPAPAPANRVAASEPKIVVPSAAAPPSQSMDDRIRAALRIGSFDLYAQRIASMREAQQSPRFEVLLRMRDAGKLHGPPTFFAAAESSQLLPELDCWVIGELLKTLRRRAVTVRASCLEFSVNVAGQSLATPQFADFIVAEVCRTAIPAGLLVFEISERTALEHEDDMENLSARLRDVGCRVALDNCRSGLGTLDPLNKWPVSRVKIDGSLIRSLGSSVRAESQVRAVAQLAADRGIETVAECVESQRVQDKLLEMGIDFAQGFHLAKPQPLQTLFR